MLGLQHTQGTLELAAEVRSALIDLRSWVHDICLWWIPSHINFDENDDADFFAGQAAAGNPNAFSLSIPNCRTSLRSQIRQYYVAQLEAQWANSSMGRALFRVMPHFPRSLDWTKRLSRQDASLVAQFLTDHYPTNECLHRFHIREHPDCDWCHHPIDDRQHRLLHCPRFFLTRQRLASEIESQTSGSHGWTWNFLVGPGKQFLAKFLQAVRVAASLD